MKALRFAGLALLALLWIWLSQGLLRSEGGVSLYKLLLIAISGAIIFVPLYKKYFKANNDK